MNKYLDFARELKNVEHECPISIIVIDSFGQGFQRLKIRGRIETLLTVVKISQNTEKRARDLRRLLAVSQNPVKHHQLRMVQKTCKK